MNREQRRAESRAKLMRPWLTAVEVCAKCGGPICPLCGVEADWCPQCGEHHCGVCGAYVQGPTEGAQ